MAGIWLDSQRRSDLQGPFLVVHDLHLREEFTLAALAMQAQGRDLTAIPSGRHDAAGGVSPAVVIAGISEAPGWAVLRDECWTAGRRTILDEALSAAREWSRASDPGTHEVDRSVIVTSAGAVTRTHVDVDESYLLQVHGYKTIGFLAPGVLPDEVILDVHRGRRRRLAVTREQAMQMRKFVIGPGQGVHVPYGWPHATRVGDDYSVSISLAFQTDRTLDLRGQALAEVATPQSPAASIA